MKKLLFVFIILASFLIGFLSGILISNRYSSETTLEGLRIIKTDKLTGKIEIFTFKGSPRRYIKTGEIRK